MKENNIVALFPPDLKARIEGFAQKDILVAKLTAEQSAVLAKLEELPLIAENYHFIPPAKREERERLKTAIYNNTIPKLLYPKETQKPWEPATFIQEDEGILFAVAGRDVVLKDCVSGLLLTPRRALLFRDFNNTKAKSLYMYGAGMFHAPIQSLKGIVVSEPTQDHSFGYISFAFMFSGSSIGKDEQAFRCAIRIDNSIARENLLQILKKVEAFAPVTGLKIEYK